MASIRLSVCPVGNRHTYRASPGTIAVSQKLSHRSHKYSAMYVPRNHVTHTLMTSPNKNVGPAYCRAEMYAGLVACCPSLDAKGDENEMPSRG